MDDYDLFSEFSNIGMVQDFCENRFRTGSLECILLVNVTRLMYSQRILRVSMVMGEPNRPPHWEGGSSFGEDPGG